jgi:hypothetical protein
MKEEKRENNLLLRIWILNSNVWFSGFPYHYFFPMKMKSNVKKRQRHVRMSERISNFLLCQPIIVLFLIFGSSLQRSSHTLIKKSGKIHAKNDFSSENENFPVCKWSVLEWLLNALNTCEEKSAEKCRK